METRPTPADTTGTAVPAVVFDACRARYGTFSECPLCGHGLIPEHAHFKCTGCGWRDSCCD
ncbi:MAG: hypothetical protein EBS48_00730 [Actinobacteria bacterium]|nr:hypothetical protein [Actinomycetota bacterium]NBU15535.1 hypothetical protein [Actinomycetota bacterium]